MLSLELYRSEDPEYNWMEYLYARTPDSTIHSLTLNVDRGIDDFLFFPELIDRAFPSLKELTLMQNYSPKDCPASHFESFLCCMQFRTFVFEDCQSAFVDHVDFQKIFNSMPNGASYTIKRERSYRKGGKRIYKHDKKLLVVYI